MPTERIEHPDGFGPAEVPAGAVSMRTVIGSHTEVEYPDAPKQPAKPRQATKPTSGEE
ncbi:hypothetical protein [Fodinicola feengrottensis]|uniref:Uncharacterized protein n=1 Tax=Fodinicola feengrottensis TaxID=435914 RepID=A0ABN2IV18_9ACTN|nr:hypothetical protein [Fodinicola feengrottensis]